MVTLSRKGGYYEKVVSDSECGIDDTFYLFSGWFRRGRREGHQRGMCG
jgi:hypothetical protein